MPMPDAYTVYVVAPSIQHAGWIVRVYRESDGQHIHSSEGCDTLTLGMRETERAITKDVNARLGTCIARSNALVRNRSRAVRGL